MFGRSQPQTDGLGLEILHPLTPDNNCTVDIILIHGLNGSRRTTFTKGNTLWPRDILALDFPDARIMTWGYDADVMRFLGPVGQGNIQDHAKALNRDISQERFEEHQKCRPIIFIAHSLGGLIVKGALFLSYLEGKREAPASINPRLAAIRMCTQGILFAGTPHQGSDKVKWAATATKLAWFIQKDQSTRLLDALERGSDVLETLQDNFKNILEGFAVYTLIEEIAYPKIGKIVEKDSARIGWHEIEVLIHANHSDMVKFASATDNDPRGLLEV